MGIFSRKKKLNVADLASMENDIQKLISDYYSAHKITLHRVDKDKDGLILNMTIENQSEISLGIKVER